MSNVGTELSNFELVSIEDDSPDPKLGLSRASYPSVMISVMFQGIRSGLVLLVAGGTTLSAFEVGALVADESEEDDVILINGREGAVVLPAAPELSWV